MAKKVEIEQKEIDAPYELPEGWKWVRLGDVVKIHNGDRGENYPSKKDYVIKGIPFINAGCLDDGFIDYTLANYISEEKFDSLRAGKIQRNDILYCLRGSLGKIGIVRNDEKGAISSSLCIFRFSNFIIPDFLLYLLKSNVIHKQQKRIENGTAQPNLSAKEVANYLLPYPPTLAEQQRIVNRIESMFAKLDEAKEKAQDVVDSFETRKAAILHKAFTGELTANWRKENGISDDSWEEKILGNICEVTSSKRVYQSEQTSSGIPFLRIADLICKIQGDVFTPELFISEELFDSLVKQGYTPKKNDILVTARGTIGRCYLITTQDKFYFQDGMISWLRNINSCLSSQYLMLLFQSKLITKQIDEFQNGSTVNYLSISMLKKFVVPVPSLPEQQEIVRILDTVLEKERTAKSAAEQVLEQIDLLKKSILARAFRGEL